MAFSKITYVNLYEVCDDVIMANPNDAYISKRVLAFENIDKFFKAFTIRLFSDLKWSSAEVRTYVEDGFAPNPTIYKQIMQTLKTRANFALCMANFLIRIAKDIRYRETFFNYTAHTPLPAAIHYYMREICNSVGNDNNINFVDLGFLYARAKEVLFYSQQYRVMKLTAAGVIKSAMTKIFNDDEFIKVYNDDGQLEIGVLISRVKFRDDRRILNTKNVPTAINVLYVLYIYSRMVSKSKWIVFFNELRQRCIELNYIVNHETYTAKFVEITCKFLEEKTGLSRATFLAM